MGHIRSEHLSSSSNHIRFHYIYTIFYSPVVIQLTILLTISNISEERRVLAGGVRWYIEKRSEWKSSFDELVKGRLRVEAKDV